MIDFAVAAPVAAAAAAAVILVVLLFFFLLFVEVEEAVVLFRPFFLLLRDAFRVPRLEEEEELVVPLLFLVLVDFFVDRCLEVVLVLLLDMGGTANHTDWYCFCA